MNRNTKIGVALIIGPFILLPVVLSAFAVTSFVMQQKIAVQQEQSYNLVEDSRKENTGELDGSNVARLTSDDLQIQTGLDNAPEAYVGAYRLVRVMFGVLGLIAVLGIVIGLPFGIYLIMKKDESTPPTPTQPTKV